MFDRAFEFVPADDVLAARSCARTLLSATKAPAELLTQARLVLAAACLHIHARVGPDPTFTELRDLLLDLRVDAAAWAALAASPIQLVQYTAAELADAQDGLAMAIDLAVRAINAVLT